MFVSADAELSPWLRRVLDSRGGVGALTEVAVWIAVGYLAVGLTWSLFHPDGVQRIQEQLEQQLQLPAGTNYQLVALGEASVLWPVASGVASVTVAHQG